jgi:hypothetical protein
MTFENNFSVIICQIILCAMSYYNTGRRVNHFESHFVYIAQTQQIICVKERLQIEIITKLDI